MLFKKLLVLVCLLTTIKVSGQTNIMVKGDTLILPNGAKFWKGEEVTLGNGSAPDRSFLFDYEPEYLHVTKKKPVSSIFSTRRGIIKKFQKDGEYKHSNSYNIIVINFGDIKRYWCDVQGAVESKELVNVYYDHPHHEISPPRETHKTKSAPKKNSNKPTIF